MNIPALRSDSYEAALSVDPDQSAQMIAKRGNITAKGKHGVLLDVPNLSANKARKSEQIWICKSTRGDCGKRYGTISTRMKANGIRKRAS